MNNLPFYVLSRLILFWVVAYQNLPETESISLVSFKELYGEVIRFNQVREEVDKLFPQ